MDQIKQEHQTMNGYCNSLMGTWAFIILASLLLCMFETFHNKNLNERKKVQEIKNKAWLTISIWAGGPELGDLFLLLH